MTSSDGDRLSILGKVPGKSLVLEWMGELKGVR